ncbi:MAG TPA: ATPase, T2SS/T4P/T4SS family [Smithellaceae bacterium]|nr:ATPase, T2SS/T4P/T4SS family [Smithellaceae bacterium]
MSKTSTYIKKSLKEEISEAPQVEELLKNLEFHKSIQRITSRINSAENIREIIVDIKEDIRKLFNIYVLTIYVVDKAKKEIFTLQNGGTKTKEIRLPIDNTTFAGYVARKKKMLHVSDAYNVREIRRINDALRFDDSLDEKTGILTGQIIASPILYDGNILGVMEIMNKKNGETIDDYSHIFLDEIESCLAKAFFMLLDFEQAGHKRGERYEKLIHDGIVTPEQMNYAIKASFATKEDVATILMERYNVSKEYIGAALSDHFSCPFRAYSDDLPVINDLLYSLDKSALIDMLWFPLNVVKGKIHVLVEDPSNLAKRREIEKMLETDSVVYEVALSSDILRLIHLHYLEKDEELSAEPAVQRLFAEHPRDPDPGILTRPETIAKPEPPIEPESIVVPESENGPRNGDSFLSGITHTEALTPETAPATAFQNRYQSDVRPSDGPLQAAAIFLRDLFPKDMDHDIPEEPATATITTTAESAIAVATVPQSRILPLFTDIIYDAYNRRGSDIHFEPDAAGKTIYLRVRIDGQCLKNKTITAEEYAKFTDQVKQLANLSQTRQPAIQQGNLTLTRPSGNAIHMRATFIPTHTGPEDLVIHISAKAKKIPLELLGLSENHYKILVNILRQPRGMLFIVGPPGAGMNTTLHACLDNINTPEKKIWTAEESIEITQDGLRQVPVDPRKGLDYPAVLRSFLNADPDIIAASRICDPETAGICMEASLKRHLVISTLWADHIIDAMEKFLDMGISRLIFADAMLSIMEQRLMKTLCPKCKEKYHPGQEEYEEIAQLYGKENFEKLNIPYSNHFYLFRPRGCDACGQTGYAGRMCVSEIFIFTREIKRMIRRKESIESIYQAAAANGMTTLLQEGISKVLSGFSDLRQVKLTCVRKGV